MREKTGFRTCLVAMVVTLLVGSNLQATIWYVKQNATGSGTSWTDASGNLKNILDGAQPLDEVWVAEGTYTPGAQVSDKFELPVLVEVYGGFSGTPGTEEVFTERDPVARPTVLSGLLQTQPEVRSQTIVFATSVGQDTLLDGFTITGATRQAIYNNSNASPTFRNLIVENNTRKVRTVTTFWPFSSGFSLPCGGVPSGRLSDVFRSTFPSCSQNRLSPRGGP